MSAGSRSGYSFEIAKSIIDDSEIVSFDFFDTLVTRLSGTPDSVQQYTGYRLERQKSSLKDFYARRKSAETSIWARRPDIGDVDLAMIYAEFPTDAIWTAEAVEMARKLEIDVDQQFIRPREKVAALLSYAKDAGKRTILVSDTYFPRIFLEAILGRFGWRNLIDEIYVSSEHKTRKGTGGLWEKVAAVEDLGTKRFVHFGDNPHSDGAAVRNLGLRCALLPDPASLAAKRGINHVIDVDWRGDILLGPLFARLGNDPFAPASSAISDEHEFGYVVYGPILLTFFAWLMENRALRPMKRLFFSAREGYFLQRLYDRMIEEFGFRGLPASQYLPISRRAVIMASQAIVFDPAEILDGGGFRGSVEQFLRARLGLAFEEPIHFPIPVRLPNDRAYLEKVLTILRPSIVERAESERAAMVAYCREAGFNREDLVGLVDIGYSATIQRGLQRILGIPLTGFYMATQPRAIAVRDSHGQAYGCFQDAIYGDMAPLGFLDRTILLEALLTAPHGQLAKFETSDLGVVGPVYLAEGYSQANFSILNTIFEGGLAYCKDLVKTAGVDVLGAILPARQSAFCALNAVFARQLKLSEHISRALFLEDDFCGNGEIKCLPSAPS